MTVPSGTHPEYSHGLLVHDTDDELVEETRAFVGQGLDSGGQVLVHGTRDRVGLMQRVFGNRAGLEYGFDEEMYLEPTRTLFGYQRRLAERRERTVFWATGTVPLGRDDAGQAAFRTMDGQSMRHETGTVVGPRGLSWTRQRCRTCSGRRSRKVTRRRCVKASSGCSASPRDVA
jgi:hypothetical protein